MEVHWSKGYRNLLKELVFNDTEQIGDRGGTQKKFVYKKKDAQKKSTMPEDRYCRGGSEGSRPETAVIDSETPRGRPVTPDAARRKSPDVTTLKPGTTSPSERSEGNRKSPLNEVSYN